MQGYGFGVSMITLVTGDGGAEIRIRTVIQEHARLAVDVNTLDGNADLYEAGMTSLASVSLMLALEDEFDIEFPDLMLRRETFGSVISIRSALLHLNEADA